MNGKTIGIDEIKTTQNIRTTVDDLKELMMSIRLNGLLQPVGLRVVSGGYVLDGKLTLPKGLVLMVR